MINKTKVLNILLGISSVTFVSCDKNNGNNRIEQKKLLRATFDKVIQKYGIKMNDEPNKIRLENIFNFLKEKNCPDDEKILKEIFDKYFINPDKTNELKNIFTNNGDLTSKFKRHFFHESCSTDISEKEQNFDEFEIAFYTYAQNNKLKRLKYEHKIKAIHEYYSEQKLNINVIVNGIQKHFNYNIKDDDLKDFIDVLTIFNLNGDIELNIENLLFKLLPSFTKISNDNILIGFINKIKELYKNTNETFAIDHKISIIKHTKNYIINDSNIISFLQNFEFVKNNQEGNDAKIDNKEYCITILNIIENHSLTYEKWLKLYKIFDYPKLINNSNNPSDSLHIQYLLYEKLKKGEINISEDKKKDIYSKLPLLPNENNKIKFENYVNLNLMLQMNPKLYSNIDFSNFKEDDLRELIDRYEKNKQKMDLTIFNYLLFKDQNDKKINDNNFGITDYSKLLPLLKILDEGSLKNIFDCESYHDLWKNLSLFEIYRIFFRTIDMSQFKSTKDDLDENIIFEKYLKNYSQEVTTLDIMAAKKMLCPKLLVTFLKQTTKIGKLMEARPKEIDDTNEINDEKLNDYVDEHKKKKELISIKNIANLLSLNDDKSNIYKEYNSLKDDTIVELTYKFVKSNIESRLNDIKDNIDVPKVTDIKDEISDILDFIERFGDNDTTKALLRIKLFKKLDDGAVKSIINDVIKKDIEQGREHIIYRLYAPILSKALSFDVEAKTVNLNNNYKNFHIEKEEFVDIIQMILLTNMDKDKYKDTTGVDVSKMTFEEYVNLFRKLRFVFDNAQRAFSIIDPSNHIVPSIQETNKFKIDNDNDYYEWKNFKQFIYNFYPYDNITKDIFEGFIDKFITLANTFNDKKKYYDKIPLSPCPTLFALFVSVGVNVTQDYAKYCKSQHIGKNEWLKIWSFDGNKAADIAQNLINSNEKRRTYGCSTVGNQEDNEARGYPPTPDSSGSLYEKFYNAISNVYGT